MNNQEIKTPRFLTVLLAFCMFTTGASGLVNEYVLATITTYILGNSIEQFSIIIASMMLMMGLAGFVQSKISDVRLIHKFMFIEIALALLGGFAPLAVYGAFGYFESHFQYILYFFVLSIGFLIGFEIPIVMRIINQHKVSLKANLTIVYAMDYVGAFVGALIWIKFLLKNYPLTEISFIVAGSNFLIAAITIMYFLQTNVIGKRIIPITLVGLTFAILAFGYSQNRDLNDLLEQKFYDDPIVYKETTKYQHLVITKSNYNNDVRLYINGNTQTSSLDEKRYHDFLVHPLMSLVANAKNILVLGGGDGLALRELLKYKSIESITLIELDPDMIKVASTNTYMRKMNNDSFKDARVHTQTPDGVKSVNVKGVYLSAENAMSGKPDEEWVGSVDVYTLDADQFISRKNNKKWDAVIIDFPDPSSVELSKLYSKQFYRKLKSHLSRNALIAIQSTSPIHAKEVFLSIGYTLVESGYKTIPYRQNIPSFGDWGFYLAWNSEKTISNMDNKIKDIKQFQVETDFITPQLFRASLVFGKGELVSKNKCVNTIMFPCLLTQYTDYSWQQD